jgi:hypothetical protein
MENENLEKAIGDAIPTPSAKPVDNKSTSNQFQPKILGPDFTQDTHLHKRNAEALLESNFRNLTDQIFNSLKFKNMVPKDAMKEDFSEDIRNGVMHALATHNPKAGSINSHIWNHVQGNILNKLKEGTSREVLPGDVSHINREKEKPQNQTMYVKGGTSQRAMAESIGQAGPEEGESGQTSMAGTTAARLSQNVTAGHKKYLGERQALDQSRIEAIKKNPAVAAHIAASAEPDAPAPQEEIVQQKSTPKPMVVRRKADAVPQTAEEHIKLNPEVHERLKAINANKNKG